MVLDTRVGESETNRLLADYSVEMTAKDIKAVSEVAGLVPAGTLVNVTFLGNEDTDMRLAAASAARQAGFVPVPHIAARRLTDRRELDDFLAGLAADAAVNRVVVVGGDPSEPLGPFPGALEVIESGLLEAHGVQHVSIGGYPEGHPDISEPMLWRALEDKSVALAERGLGGSRSSPSSGSTPTRCCAGSARCGAGASGCPSGSACRARPACGDCSRTRSASACRPRPASSRSTASR